MQRDELRALLADVAEGRVDAEDALGRIGTAPYRELSCGLSLDLARGVRTGQGEVVFGQGKNRDQLEGAVRGLSEAGQPVLVTRLGREAGEHLAGLFPAGRFWDRAGLFVLGRELSLAPPFPHGGELLIVTAGASDLPVALEALGTAQFYGLDAGLLSDMGVAGLHRMLPHVESLRKAKLHIVVAGMEGALPSVFAGLCGRPVVAVPTSVGYGASFGGIAALLSMLSSCAPGVSVVNIDNGYGAAVVAAKLLRP
jgi:NCAIR mutase (PurE)-related protein